MTEVRLNKSMLQQLGEYLLTNLKPYVKPNDFDAWQESGTLLPNGEDLGTGCRVAKWKYTANFVFDKFPHRKINQYNLFALIAVFLLENGEDREQFGLNDPEIDIDEQSEDSTQVIITIELMDDVEIVPDENGLIEFNGVRYRVDTAPIYFAEKALFEESAA